jgi:hypothetical protein
MKFLKGIAALVFLCGMTITLGCADDAPTGTSGAGSGTVTPDGGDAPAADAPAADAPAADAPAADAPAADAPAADAPAADAPAADAPAADAPAGDAPTVGDTPAADGSDK